MARPKKKGLDYFPLDVDIFDDDKLFDVQNEYGPLGEVIYIRLLCLVYRNGYYYRFDNLDKLAAMMMRSIGNRWTKDKKTVKDVILYLAKINLFSSELMQRNVITSRSIQERYLLAVERRQSKIEEYSLLGKNDNEEGLLPVPGNSVSVTETRISDSEISLNVSNNATKESKEKESKVNESKVNESKEKESGGEKTSSSASRLVFGEYCNILLTAEEYQQLNDYYGRDNVDKYIRKMDIYLAEKGRSYDNCCLKLKQWLDADNVKKPVYSDGFIPDKYKEFINMV